jgi:hypothetical protein
MSDQAVPQQSADGGMGAAVEALRARREADASQSPEPEPEQSQPEVEPEESGEFTEDEVFEDEAEGDLEADTADEEPQIIEINGRQYTPEQLDEIERSGLRDKDYRQKTQALSEKRKIVEQQEQAAAYGLGLLQQKVLGKLERFNGIDLEQLARTNPQEYQATMASREVAQRELEEVQGSIQTFLDQVKQREEQTRQVSAERAAEILRRDIRGWNEQVYYEDLEHAQSLGMDQEEAYKLTDPAILKALHNSRLYEAGKKVAAKKKAPKKLTGKGRSQQGSGIQNLERQLQSGNATMDQGLELLRARRQNR